ncbi:MAG: FxLYD domain-containing protein [Bacillota bacterium]|nr:FxLYD domain-containing protein [Bacillota bacterium]
MRYEVIKKVDDKCLFPDLPITLQCYALTRDNKENKLLAQLKFMNTGDARISALAIEVDVFDETGNKIETKRNVSYHNLSAGKDDTFGSQVPVYLDTDKADHIKVYIFKIVFEDETVKIVNGIPGSSEVVNKEVEQIQKEEPIVEKKTDSNALFKKVKEFYSSNQKNKMIVISSIALTFVLLIYLIISIPKEYKLYSFGDYDDTYYVSDVEDTSGWLKEKSGNKIDFFVDIDGASLKLACSAAEDFSVNFQYATCVNEDMETEARIYKNEAYDGSNYYEVELINADIDFVFK